MSLSLFYRLFLRPLLRERLRTSLTLLAVALGVAVVLAIDLAGAAATGSFLSSVQTLAGEADFEITAIGGVPGEVVAKLVTLPYPLKIEPRIEDYAVVVNRHELVPCLESISWPTPRRRLKVGPTCNGSKIRTACGSLRGLPQSQKRDRKSVV